MRALNRALVIRPYERRDLSATRDLVFFNYHAHTHLDWQTVDEFLREDPPLLWVAYRGDKLVGALGASDILSGTCWLRVVAAEDTDNPLGILREMWAQAQTELRALGVHTVAVLLLRDWFERLLHEFDFHYLEDIVTLRRYSRHLPPQNHTPPAIHYIEPGDIQTVRDIDHAAFDAPWQMSLAEIRYGARAATYGTLARIKGRIIGYQITTTHGLNGHLARLAVLPEAQGQGIGGALLHDMLAWFRRRNVLSVTVNTQDSNIRSQKLYEKYAFKRNGYDLPMWVVRL